MGPLHGVRVVELAGIGPGPFAAMLLADMGADVVRVDRRDPEQAADPTHDVLNRGRPSVAVDLKRPEGASVVLRLVASADALIEGFRPGVMERLGLGPEVCMGRNPALVYGRMTGWGQDGPLAPAPGHDINYIALSGALHAFARHRERPVPPVNTVGDFGGGGMLLAFGLVCGLLEAARSGIGQVVDAAMVDGSALLTTMIHALVAQGLWRDEPGTNLLDTGAHFYEVYETADGRYLSVGPLERRFYLELLRRTGLNCEELPAQLDRASWPAMKQRFAELFRTKTRDEWCALLEGTDACVAPVLTFAEAAEHPHNRARGTYVVRDGTLQPSPAPRFSRTRAELGCAPRPPGADTDEVLGAWGFSAEEIAALREAGVVGSSLGAGETRECLG